MIKKPAFTCVSIIVIPSNFNFKKGYIFCHRYPLKKLLHKFSMSPNLSKIYACFAIDLKSTDFLLLKSECRLFEKTDSKNFFLILHS